MMARFLLEQDPNYQRIVEGDAHISNDLINITLRDLEDFNDALEDPGSIAYDPYYGVLARYKTRSSLIDLLGLRATCCRVHV